MLMWKREFRDTVDLGDTSDCCGCCCARSGFSGLPTAVVADVGVEVTGEIARTPLYPLGENGVEESIAGEMGVSKTDAA
jgi:hypothetical protein